ncbi:MULTISPECIES: EAL domain-containing response regulator [Vibrio]|uniref:EAL domain-containing response regulator n=1 Tax=Vibrio TaxID=662 RepID=UPI001D124E57|nr:MULTISPECIES: response regulator [Vibrio]
MMYKSVLVVDDVELSREIIKSAVLAASDCAKVICVENAYSAISKIRSKKFDLVIMDIMMPNGDGFELLSMISQLAISTKIIVISSLDRVVIESMHQIGKLYELNIIKAIAKPIDSKSITELVVETFEQEDEPNDITNRYSNDLSIFDFPIGMYYQPQVMTTSKEIIGADVSANWFNSQNALLLSTHLLPEITTLTSKKLFNQIVIGKFLQDYKQYFKDLTNQLYFTLHIHHDFIDDSFIYSCLLELVKFNSNHHFSLYLDNDDLAKSDVDGYLDKLQPILSNGVSLILGLEKITVDRIMSASKLPIRELKFITYNNPTFGIHSNTDLFMAIDSLPKDTKMSVMLDGVEDATFSQVATFKGIVKQQGILFGGPISAEKLTKVIKNNSKNVSEGEF